MSRVIIVGGGVAGVLIAERISPHVDEVHLLEKGMLGSGTTGKSIANFATHTATTEIVSELIDRSWAVYEPLINDETLSFQNQGYLKVFESEEAFKNERADIDVLREYAVVVEELSPEECADLGIDPDAVSAGGIYYPEEGRLDPGEIISHFSTRAMDAGVHVETEVEVHGIERTDTGFHLTTSSGSLEGDIVINAAGPWAPQINDFLGVNLPLRHTIAPIAVLDTDGDVDIPTTAFENGVYLTPEESNKTLAGRFPPDMWDDAFEGDPDAEDGMGIAAVREEYRNLMVETAFKSVPALREAKLSNGWQAVRCVTPDGLPVVGETEVPGFYLATGMSGQGIALAPACADIVANLLQGDADSTVAAGLSPNRETLEVDD